MENGKIIIRKINIKDECNVNGCASRTKKCNTRCAWHCKGFTEDHVLDVEDIQRSEDGREDEQRCLHIYIKWIFYCTYCTRVIENAHLRIRRNMATHIVQKPVCASLDD